MSDKNKKKKIIKDDLKDNKEKEIDNNEINEKIMTEYKEETTRKKGRNKKS